MVGKSNKKHPLSLTHKPLSIEKWSHPLKLIWGTDSFRGNIYSNIFSLLSINYKKQQYVTCNITIYIIKHILKNWLFYFSLFVIQSIFVWAWDRAKVYLPSVLRVFVDGWILVSSTSSSYPFFANFQEGKICLSASLSVVRIYEVLVTKKSHAKLLP